MDTGSCAHGAAQFFVLCSWDGLWILLLVAVVEGAAAATKYLLTKKPAIIVSKEAELHACGEKVRSLNPKQNFVEWAFTSRRHVALKKELAVLVAEAQPHPGLTKLQRWLRYKMVAYVLIGLCWYDVAFFRVPSHWVWPLGKALALPSHAAGTVGVVSWLVMSNRVASGLARVVVGCFRKRARQRQRALTEPRATSTRGK